jgi:hypothetical protein
MQIKKRLRDYTDEELFYFIDNAEVTSVTVLANVCAEILRRQLEKKPCKTE